MKELDFSWSSAIEAERTSALVVRRMEPHWLFAKYEKPKREELVAFLERNGFRMVAADSSEGRLLEQNELLGQQVDALREQLAVARSSMVSEAVDFFAMLADKLDDGLAGDSGTAERGVHRVFRYVGDQAKRIRDHRLMKRNPWALVTAIDALMDPGLVAMADDVDHQVEYHADGLPDFVRALAKIVRGVHEVLCLSSEEIDAMETEGKAQPSLSGAIEAKKVLIEVLADDGFGIYKNAIRRALVHLGVPDKDQP